MVILILGYLFLNLGISNMIKIDPMISIFEYIESIGLKVCLLGNFCRHISFDLPTEEGNSCRPAKSGISVTRLLQQELHKPES